jgi:hypothetical protein
MIGVLTVICLRVAVAELVSLTNGFVVGVIKVISKLLAEIAETLNVPLFPEFVKPVAVKIVPAANPSEVKLPDVRVNFFEVATTVIPVPTGVKAIVVLAAPPKPM